MDEGGTQSSRRAASPSTWRGRTGARSAVYLTAVRYGTIHLRAGVDGMHLANLFLNEFTQYDENSYYIDTAVVPMVSFCGPLAK